MKKNKLLQDLKIVVFAILFLLFSVLTVLALLPEHTEIEVREAFTATASELSHRDGTYVLRIKGTLRNTTDDPIQLEKLTVRVKGVEDDLIVYEGALEMTPRADYPLDMETRSDVRAEAVQEVTVTANGKTVSLRNPAVRNTVQYAFLPFALTAVFLLFLGHSVIVRYYLAQEERIPADGRSAEK